MFTGRFWQRYTNYLNCLWFAAIWNTLDGFVIVLSIDENGTSFGNQLSFTFVPVVRRTSPRVPIDASVQQCEIVAFADYLWVLAT